MQRFTRKPAILLVERRSFVPLAVVVAMSLSSGVIAQTTPTPLPAAVDEGPRYRAYPLRQIDANTAQQKLSQYFSRSPGVETVADPLRNRVLVHGTAHDLES